jgi:hypothetical protein
MSRRAILQSAMLGRARGSVNSTNKLQYKQVTGFLTSFSGRKARNCIVPPRILSAEYPSDERD